MQTARATRFRPVVTLLHFNDGTCGVVCCLQRSRDGGGLAELALTDYTVYHATSVGGDAGAARFKVALDAARLRYGLVGGSVSVQKDARPNIDVDHATITVLASKRDDHTMTLFSGDLFNPSLESGITKGRHMVPIINALDVDAAVFGNHDFDFGVPQLTQLAADNNFPWLISNVFDNSGTSQPLPSPNATSPTPQDHILPPAICQIVEDHTIMKPLANGHRYVIIECAGYRFGLIGLVEREWLDTITSLPPNLVYVDFVKIGRDLANRLKHPTDKDKFLPCDFVLAITHMRLPNDELLAEQVPEIDLVLGGHDHTIQHIKQNGKLRIVKSGTDFRDFSVLELFIQENEGGKLFINDIRANTIHVGSDTAESPAIITMLTEIEAKMSNTLQKPVFISKSSLDATSPTVRLQESNIGSFVADILRWAYTVDIGLLCGGSIRSDLIYGPGEITVRDIMEMFPFDDPIVVIGLTGQMVWDALENGVSMWPKQEGRFPQVSGVKFTFDASKPAGSRIVSVWMTTGIDPNECIPIDLTRIYTVATRRYMTLGKDGYTSLTQPVSVIVDEENGNIISSLIRLYFIGVRTMKALKHVPKTVDMTTVTAHAEHAQLVQEITDKCKHSGTENMQRKAQIAFECANMYSGLLKRLKQTATIVTKLPVVEPKIQGRIIRLG